MLGDGDALASSRADGHVSGPLAWQQTLLRTLHRHALLRTLHHSSLHHSSLHHSSLRAQLLRCTLRLAGRPLAVGSVEGGGALAELAVP